MQEWLSAKTTFIDAENVFLERIYQSARHNIEAWSEEDLKMHFIAFVLNLGELEPEDSIRTFFDKIISATLEGHFLKTKANFMIAFEVMDLLQAPYFHFQEYKQQTDPNGNPKAQVVEAMLIAQAINQNGKPIYGCSVISKFWDFVIMEGKAYCVSKSYDCTDKEELIQIIATLRKFKEIMKTRLLD